MFRLLLAASLLVLTCRLPAQENAAPPSSAVFFTRDPLAIDRFDENPAASRRMVDSLVISATGQSDVASAWRSLVKPGDRVGIKVSAAGGRYFATRLGVVAAIVSGLEQAGIPRGQIIVWDRDGSRLRAAGFSGARLGCQVRSIVPGEGYDRDAQLTAPVLGKLIWGDLLFADKERSIFKRASSDAEQLSSTSHLARILSREITKVVNVPVLTDASGCSVGGAFYNMTIPNIDNWRRFTPSDGPGPDAIPALYADARIGGKVVLHIMDGLLAQYAGGPAGDPNYSFAHATLYASKDPVALDATALQRLEVWRKEARLPSIAPRAAWLQTAEEMGLGNFAPERIVLKKVGVK